MDHFNATIKNGKLVRTRRGLQVSRQKFNGLSFVNASPQDPSFSPGPSSSTAAEATVSRAPQPEITFIEEEFGPQSEGQGSSRKDDEQRDLSDTSSQGTRQRRKAARRLKSPAPSRTGTPSQRSPTPLTGRPSQLGHSSIHQDMLQLGLGFDHEDIRVPEPQNAFSCEDWEKFERFLDSTPRSLYPYENLLTHNPARVSDFYSVVAEDEAARHCVIMAGGIADAVINSDPRPNCLAYHISKICSILNKKLDQDQAVDVATLHSIATLARMGSYVGRLDHWHLHMSGLKKVLDLNGGLVGLPMWLVAEMYKADLRGAVALATSPYLPFTRQHGSITSILPSEVHRRTTESLAALLNPLHVNQEVVTSLTSLSLYASAVHLARQSSGAVTFDPHTFTEEWQAITHALLCQPGPLRAVNADPVASNPYATHSPPVTAPGGDAPSPTERYMSNHRLLPSVPVLPAAAASSRTPLEPAMRIAALLYLKELLPDWPRNLGGYAVLLHLLRQHLADALRVYGSRERPPAQSPHPSTSRQPSSSPPRPPSVSSSSSSSTHPSSSRPSTSLLQVARAPLAFLALTGLLVSRRADTAERRTAPDERYPRGVYRAVLRAVFGSGVAAGEYQEDDGPDNTDDDDDAMDSRGGDETEMRLDEQVSDETELLAGELFRLGLVFGEGGSAGVVGEGGMEIDGGDRGETSDWDWRGVVRRDLRRQSAL